METLYFETLPSTQEWLTAAIRENKLKEPICVVASKQSQGIGSRGNTWDGDNCGISEALTFSFAISLQELPKDLKLESVSIYYAFLMKEVLSKLDSSVWMKWPNDLYKMDKKIGGIMSSRIGNTIIVGIGVNLYGSSDKYGVLGILGVREKILRDFLEILEKHFSWKLIFSKFKVEFQKNLSYSFHYKEKKISFTEVELAEDGSLEFRGNKIYSFR